MLQCEVKMYKIIFICSIIFALTSEAMAREVFMWVQYGEAAKTITDENFSENSYIAEGTTALGLQFWNTKSDGSIPMVKPDQNSRQEVLDWIDWAHERKIKVYMTVTAFNSGLAHVWGSQVGGALGNNRDSYIRNIRSK